MMLKTTTDPLDLMMSKALWSPPVVPEDSKTASTPKGNHPAIFFARSSLRMFTASSAPKRRAISRRKSRVPAITTFPTRPIFRSWRIISPALPGPMTAAVLIFARSSFRTARTEQPMLTTFCASSRETVGGSLLTAR